MTCAEKVIAQISRDHKDLVGDFEIEWAERWCAEGLSVEVIVAAYEQLDEHLARVNEYAIKGKFEELLDRLFPEELKRVVRLVAQGMTDLDIVKEIIAARKPSPSKGD